MLADNNAIGLLSLLAAKKPRNGEVVKAGDISYGAIDIGLNKFSKEEFLNKLQNLTKRNNIWVMIHEYHYYSDHEKYQPNFEEKRKAIFSVLNAYEYKSCFLEIFYRNWQSKLFATVINTDKLLDRSSKY